VSARQLKLILIVCLLAGLFICGFGCMSLTRSINLKGKPNSLSVKSLKITMDLDQREEFFAQLQNFADKHSLELRSTFYDADKKGFLIVLAGDGFDISAISTLHSPREITIAFFNDASTPTPQKAVDELFDDLKNFINEIPNVMMTEVRKRLRITMDEGQREELFAQMRKLADKRSLEFTLSFSSDKTVFHIEIHGEGFQITADPVTGSPKQIWITFFIDYYKAPTPTSLEAVDELFDELKSCLSQIPNVTITEEK
jgi:hypothetical protein